jgi:hypothetical protein
VRVLAAVEGGTALSATDWATIVAGVVAALGFADYVRSVWRRTAGRRRDVARRFKRLGTGAQVQFFESVLGEPPAMRRRFDINEEDWGAVEDDETDPPIVTRTYLECFWIDRDYCVQTVSDQDDAVVGYSITTRNRRFRPTIHFPLPPTGRERLMQMLTLGRRRPYELARVKLGHTTFAKALRDDRVFPEIRSFVGARAYSYTELRYCGNPGHYQTFGLTMSSAAPTIGGDPARIETVDPGGDPWREYDEAPDDWLEVAPDWIKATHAHGVVTTVTIILHFPVKEWRTFGPHGDEIRTLP